MILDAKAIKKGDPSATSLSEIIICYPGFEAILNYRIAHILHKMKIPYLPRIMTERSHSKTGVDIGIPDDKYFASSSNSFSCKCLIFSS